MDFPLGCHTGQWTTLTVCQHTVNTQPHCPHTHCPHTHCQSILSTHTLSSHTVITHTVKPSYQHMHVNPSYQPTLPLPLTPLFTPPWCTPSESSQRRNRRDQQLQIPLLLHALPSGALRRGEQRGHHSIQ